MRTEDRVLELLEESRGKAVSGERLAEMLGISRTAVWKHIKALKEKGYEISSVSNRGYELIESLDVFSTKSVMDELADEVRGYTGRIGIEVEVRDEVTSTNALLKDMAAKGALEGRVLIAKRQTEGRGRLGRNFFSPKNGIYLSILLRPDMDFREAMLLTTIAAVAVVEAVREVTGRDTGIKWVNDVYLEGRKICGILTEAVTDVESGRLSYAVVGIGVNITKPSEDAFPDELKDIAGFVYDDEEPPKGVMSRLSAAIVKNYFKYYEKLPEHRFMESYKKYQILINKDIFVITPEGKKKARAYGVDDEARLLVEYEEGGSEALFTGEVSVREAGDERKNMPKFKKTICLLLLYIGLLTTVTGCKPSDGKLANNINSLVEKVKDKGYVFAVNDAEFVIGEDPTSSIDKLEAKSDTFEAPSCAMQGEDKVYTYSGFTLTLHSESKKGPYKLMSILLTDDSVQTVEGIYIGKSREEVEKAYGEQKEKGSEYIYKKGVMELSFIFAKDKVVSIEYREQGE